MSDEVRYILAGLTGGIFVALVLTVALIAWAEVRR